MERIFKNGGFVMGREINVCIWEGKRGKGMVFIVQRERERMVCGLCGFVWMWEFWGCVQYMEMEEMRLDNYVYCILCDFYFY